MKIKYCISIILLLSFLVEINAQIPADLQRQVDQVLSTEYKVYPIDKERSSNFYKSIDNFFNNSFQLGYSASEIENGLKEGKDIDTKLNIIIVTGKVVEDKEKPLTEPLKLTYSVGQYERAFVKELRKPVKAELPQNELKEISSNFLKSYKLIPRIEEDQPAKTAVFTRRVDMFNEQTKKVEKSVVLQRVITERKINDVPVLNSRVIVDVHPGTKEILAYKTFNWSPVDPRVAVQQKYKSKDSIMMEITNAIDLRQNTIEDVGAFYMQLEGFLLPVMKIDFLPSNADRTSSASEERSLVVILHAEPGISKNVRAIKQPTKAR